MGDAAEKLDMDQIIADAKESRRKAFETDPESYCLGKDGTGYKGKGVGLIEDARNIYGVMFVYIGSGQLNKDRLHSFTTYTEYILGKNDPPGYGKYLLENSKPELVQQFDAVIKEYNQALSEAQNSKEPSAIDIFLTKVAHYLTRLEAIIKS
jgi:hypothetical protein